MLQTSASYTLKELSQHFGQDLPKLLDELKVALFVDSRTKLRKSAKCITSYQFVCHITVYHGSGTEASLSPNVIYN